MALTKIGKILVITAAVVVSLGVLFNMSAVFFEQSAAAHWWFSGLLCSVMCCVWLLIYQPSREDRFAYWMLAFILSLLVSSVFAAGMLVEILGLLRI